MNCSYRSRQDKFGDIRDATFFSTRQILLGAVANSFSGTEFGHPQKFEQLLAIFIILHALLVVSIALGFQLQHFIFVQLNQDLVVVALNG